MASFDSVEGFDALPRRIFLEGEREPIPDQDGFILPIGTVLTPKHLLQEAAVLAVAPPWTGKTTVAEGISRALKIHPFSALTCFEERERGIPVKPDWWDRWKESEDPAFWLVDAVDEDDRKDRQSVSILQLLRDLTDEARGRLHLIAFCRINEVPDWFENRLEGVYGGRLRRLRLAGLDRESARLHVGHSRFDHVCQLIRSNDLQPLAPYPSVLKYLAERAGREEGESLTKEKVWEGVLTDLLREKRDDLLRPSFESEVEDRFKVAQRLAALTTFCGLGAVRPDTGLESAFPSTLPGHAELRVAARETWKTSIFERSDRGFRFSQDHVRQWLTAFALREMTLGQLRPLLTLESGPLDPSHEGFVGLLAQISRHEEVRDWIVAAHGGLPDSDSASWSLPQAARALDKLQEIARSSPWGLSVWREERLRTFRSVPGIGAEVARRLDLPLQSAERQLLLEMAFVIGAPEPLLPASRLLQEEGEDERVRAQAAGLVAQLGTEEDLRSLAGWVESLQEIKLHGAVLPRLVAAFYDWGLWSFESAAGFALSQSGIGGDWLEYHLAEGLSLERARWMLGKYLVLKPDVISQHLVLKAVELILSLEVPDETDFDLLQPLLFWTDIRRNRNVRISSLRSFFIRNLEARRNLFLEGLRRDPERRVAEAWIWSHILEAEDSEWLLEILLALNNCPAWTWETLYLVAYRPEVRRSIRTRVRREIGSFDESLLRRLDRHRERNLKTLRKLRREQSTEDERQVYELETLVRDTLSSSELDLYWKMLRLSWSCFTSGSYRPAEVSGDWNDLPAQVCAQVLEVCRQALLNCQSTPIPDGSSFPSRIMWEAACFDHLLKEDSAFILTSDLVRQWLPSVLTAWKSEYESTLRGCIDTDRDLTEDLFREFIRREIRGGSTHNFILQKLPPELWSKRFSALLEEMVLDHEVDPQARIDLLVRIGRIFPLRASPIALCWASSTDLSLRDAGVDILLMVAPEEGWRHLKALLKLEKPEDVVRRMRSLHPHHYGPAADFQSWPAARLRELHELLIGIFPPEADPKWAPGEVRSLGEDDDLRSVRDDIPRLLYRRDGDGDRATLEALAGQYQHIREWLDAVQAQQGAEGVLAALGRGARPPGSGRLVPLPLMVKLLQDPRSRVLGSVDDLQDVILEQIGLIAQDAKQHLSVLYRPRPKEKGGKRKHLQEDALQAYLYFRLKDRLPVALESHAVKVAFIDRETLAPRNTRNDLKIQAVSYEEKPLTVIIEIKWSDHPDVSISLVHQLGEGYLLQARLTHGIYLVGWSGEPGRWKETARGKRPTPRTDPGAWQRALEEQAQLFVQEHPDHPGLRITPVVLDLSW